MANLEYYTMASQVITLVLYFQMIYSSGVLVLRIIPNNHKEKGQRRRRERGGGGEVVSY